MTYIFRKLHVDNSEAKNYEFESWFEWIHHSLTRSLCMHTFISCMFRKVEIAVNRRILYMKVICYIEQMA